jgi:hypothetical protein
MQINKINDVAAPSVRKIQSKMTEVIEHFKTKGYIPSNSNLERTPDADCFDVAEKVAHKPFAVFDCTIFRAKDGSKLEIGSFKMFKDSSNYCTERTDYNEAGQRVRHIFDDGDCKIAGEDVRRFSLDEYEYAGKDVVKRTRFERVGDDYYKVVKKVEPTTGDYSIETSYLDNDYREVINYNGKHQKLMETKINYSFPGLTIKRVYNPETGEIVAFERGRIIKCSDRQVFECTKVELDKQTGQISKFEYNYGNDVLKFERDTKGNITSFVHRMGSKSKEFRYDVKTGTAFLKHYDGKVYESSPHEGLNFVRWIDSMQIIPKVF